MMREAIDRIVLMELCFDVLQNKAATDPAAIREDGFYRELLRILRQYYEGGQWLRDYELDEQGRLPRELKRGVLAQDAVYDFLSRVKLSG